MSKNTKKTKKRVIGISIVALIVIALVAVFAFLHYRKTQTAPESQLVPPVPLQVENAGNSLKIGVIYSLTNDPNQGSGWYPSAQGAQVAAYRLTQGGLTTNIVVANDNGTDDGAQQAVKELAGKGVSGIVVASSGSHCKAIATQAKQADIPVIFLYEDITDSSGVWTFAPQKTEIFNKIESALGQSNLKTPLVISDGSVNIPQGIDSVVWDSFQTNMPNDDETRQDISTRVNRALEGKTYDSFIVSGNPVFQAFVVTSLEEAGLSFPIFLTPQSSNPLFAQTLNNMGTLSGDFRSLGLTDADVLSLTSGTPGNAASSFLAALRALDSNPSAMTLDSSTPFSQFSTYADTLSHDAVLAFAYACGQADTCEASKVSDALSDLSLTQENGILFSSLDFSQPYPYPEDVFAPVYATDQDMGLRSTQPQARLYWYSSEE